MKEIKLSQFGKNRGKYVALVDDEDFEALNQFNWYAQKHGDTPYAGRKIIIDGKKVMQYMHGAILSGKGVDHIDGNGCNNTRSNLRFCTQSENAMNMRKQENTSSIYKGVSFSKQRVKWEAYIMINRKRIRLGYFDTEVEAAKAYNAKAIELFCEFANLNEIN